MKAAVRRFAAVVWFVSLGGLAAVLSLAAINAYLASDNDSKLLNAVVADKFPGVNIHYTRAHLRLSLDGGAHVRTQDLSVAKNGMTLFQAEQADFFLNDEALHIALYSPRAHIPALAGVFAAGAASNEEWGQNLLLRAADAQLTFEDAPLTLQSADIAVRHDKNGWQLKLTEERDILLRADAAFADNGRGRFAVAFAGKPPFGEFADQHVNITLWAAIGDNITAAASGLWQPPEGNVSFAAAGEADFAGRWQLKKGRFRLFDDSATVIANAAAAGDKTNVTLAGGNARLADATIPALMRHLPTDARRAVEEWGGGVSVTVHAAAAGLWRGNEEGWTVNNGRLRLFNEEIRLAAAVTIAATVGGLPMVAATGHVGALALTAVFRHLPNGGVRDWFVFALKGGDITDANFFIQTGGGAKADIILLTAAFSDGVLHIADGWPRARALAGALVVDGGGIRIDGEGVYGGIAVTHVIARVPNAGGDRATLFLDMRGAPASVAEHLKMAKQTPPVEAAAKAASDFSLRGGRAAVSLSVSLPLASPAEAAAAALLQIRHATAAPPGMPELTGIGGEIFIDNDDIRGHLRGRLSDGDSLTAPVLNIDFVNDEASIRGRADISVILSIAAAPPLPVAGETDFLLTRSPTATVFTAPLAGVYVSLPPPFGGAAEGVSVRFYEDGFAVTYRGGGNTVRLRTAGGGDLAINDEARHPPAAGWNVHGAANGANVDAWLNLGGDGGGLTLAGVTLTLADATLFGNFHRTLVVESPSPTDGGRHIRMRAADIDGELHIDDDSIAGQFSRVRLSVWPPSSDNDNDGGGGGDNLALSITVATFVIPGDITLGAASLFGEPRGENWQLSHFRLANGDSLLNLSGEQSGGDTSLSLHLTAQSMPEFLKIFHFPEVLGDGLLTLSGNINWPGAPTDFDLASLSGKLQLNAEDWQYLDTSTSAGLIDILAIFSPQSLVGLGFTDLGRGVTFETVSGDIRLANGTASTDEILLVGKESNPLNGNLLLNIRGETNYIRRRHNLYGKVRPGQKLLEAGSTLGVGAVAAGVLAAPALPLLAVPFFGKLFGTPISEIGSYEYTITGDWDDPIYTEVGVIDEEDEDVPQ